MCKEMRYVADSAATDSSKRGFTLSFHLENQLYPKNKDYYFVIIDEDNDFEVLREEIRIDLGQYLIMTAFRFRRKSAPQKVEIRASSLVDGREFMRICGVL